MRITRIWLPLAAAMLAAASLSPHKPSHTTLFTRGKDACQTISFPERWITQDLTAAYKKEAEELGIPSDPALSFMFRHKLDQGEGVILVAVSRDDDVLSPRKYSVSLDPSLLVQAIDDSEWKSAPIARFGDGWEKHLGKLQMEGAEGLRNPVKMFETGSRISPDRKWAALFRWHGRLDPQDEGVPSHRLAPSIVPTRDEYSVDLVETATEQPAVSFHGVFDGVSTTNVTDNLGWITDRIFWMPLDNAKQAVLICDANHF